MTDHSGGQMIETEAKAVEQGMAPADIWLKKIAKAKEGEKKWRDEARKAIAIYEGDKDALTRENQRPISFNIYHSNVETMVPAVYNSTPIPDVRRRYDDAPQAPQAPQPPMPQQGGMPGQPPQPQMQQPQQPQQPPAPAGPDPINKLAVDVIERALSYSVDQYDFDTTMVGAVRGSLVGGRGVVRVRYTPHMQAEAAIEGATEEAGEVKGYEEVTCEVVPWDRFIKGPARTWEHVPWIAYEHDLTREEIDALADDPERAADVRLEGEHSDKNDNSATPDAGIFKTTKVYEIWEKKSGLVIFLEDKKDSRPLKVEQDPLGLPGFFPSPRPLQPIIRETSMTPVCPYSIYAPLIEELDAVTKRITNLVKQLRVRGLYDAELKADLTLLQNADDGTYIAASDATRFAQGSGGLEKAIAHWPMEPIVIALKELYVQREQIKQTIYEVTGLADIVRGASQASETATAQQIKAQYAGLRIQSLQKEVARMARDLFRMKAAIFCAHFSMENLSVMTGLDVSPAEQLLRSDAMRSYRIDIETDSTVRGDVGRALEQMTQFIQGTGQFVQALGGLVQTVPALLPPMMDVYAAFARKFDLGKQAEDALDKMPVMVQQFVQAQQQQAQGPNPEQQKAEMEMKSKQQDMQLKQESAEFDIQHKTKLAQLDIESKQAAQQMELQHKQATQAMDMDHLQRTRGMEMQHKREAHGADMENKRAATEFSMVDREHGLRAKQDLHAMDAAKAEREAETETKVAAEIPDALKSVAEAITTLRQDIKAIPAKIRQARPDTQA